MIANIVTNREKWFFQIEKKNALNFMHLISSKNLLKSDIVLKVLLQLPIQMSNITIQIQSS